jgi:hypothetical protein
MLEIGDGSFKDENRMLTITENYKATLLSFEIRHNKMYNGFFFHFKTDQQAKCISCHKKLISEIINKSEGNF